MPGLTADVFRVCEGTQASHGALPAFASDMGGLLLLGPPAGPIGTPALVPSSETCLRCSATGALTARRSGLVRWCRSPRGRKLYLFARMFRSRLGCGISLQPEV